MSCSPPPELPAPVKMDPVDGPKGQSNGCDIGLVGLACFARTSQWTEPFEQAIAAARAGDLRLGRELCSAALLEAQPLLSRCEWHLRNAVIALLVSACFRLLSRLIRALTGKSVCVVLGNSGRASDAPLRFRENTLGKIITVDPRWLIDLSVDGPFLRAWCQELARGEAMPAQLITKSGV